MVVRMCHLEQRWINIVDSSWNGASITANHREKSNALVTIDLSLALLVHLPIKTSLVVIIVEIIIRLFQSESYSAAGG